MATWRARVFAFPRHARARVFASNLVPRQIRGRRECRANRSPAVSRVKEKHTKVVTTGLPKRSGIPCAMVYGFLRGLPGDRAFLPPSPADNSANLISASRYQDATTSPSASLAFVLRKAKRPPLPVPNVRDDSRKRPSSRARDARECAADLPDGTTFSACDISTRRANQVRLENSCQVTSNCLPHPGRGASLSGATQIRNPGVAQLRRMVFVSNLLKRWNGGLQNLNGLVLICSIAIDGSSASKNPYGKPHPLQSAAKA
jgi:hypothetical protein